MHEQHGRTPAVARQALALIGAMSVLFGAASASAAEKVRISLPLATAGSAFFIIALQKHYYEEEGLEVDPLVAPGGIATPALIAGDLQFSLSTGASISAILKGARLKVIMVTQDRPGGQVLSTKPQIRSLEDLRGQQIAIQSRGDTGEVAILSLLKSRGLPKDYVSFTPISTTSGRLAALKSGALPAVQLTWTEIEDLKSSETAPATHVVIDLYRDVRMPYNGLVTSDALIKNRPDLVEKVVRASLKGVAYARTFRDESVKLIADYGKLPLQPTAVDFDYVMTSALPSNTVSDEIQSNEIAVRAEILGLPDGKGPENAAVFDFGIIRRVSEELKASGWKPVR